MHVKQQEVATFAVCERDLVFVFFGRRDATLMFAGRKASKGCLFRPVTERKMLHVGKVVANRRSKLSSQMQPYLYLHVPTWVLPVSILTLNNLLETRSTFCKTGRYELLSESLDYYYSYAKITANTLFYIRNLIMISTLPYCLVTLLSIAR